MEPITRESVERMRGRELDRVCFKMPYTWRLERTPDERYFGRIYVPFGDGFNRICPVDLFPNVFARCRKEAYWRRIRYEAEFDEIAAWVKRQGSRVFLRDCLYTSVALSPNFSGGMRTKIGELEYQAKWRSNSAATSELAERCVGAIKDLFNDKDVDQICAVPLTPGKRFSLPSRVAKIVSRRLGKGDITADFRFWGEKGSLKNVKLDEKWGVLDKAQLRFDGADISGKRIILIDDLYQSGTTMQYAAMKLQEAGAYQVCGLSMVKSLSNDDNQQSWYGS